ncbi:acetolactate synthase large subunit, partial [Enterococcus sp. S181_ASV_20]|nr:acetolactate synthase large subunit [Enterococcus sp. S181_ASV_20]
FYDKRYSYTKLKDDDMSYLPDFIALGRSYGVDGIRITDEEELDHAFIRAKGAKNQPFILEFMLKTEQKVLPIVPVSYTHLTL